MGTYKFIVVVGIIVGLFIFIGSIYFQQSGILMDFWDKIRPKGEQIITILPSPPKRVDKLFTTFVYMPILDYKKNNTTIKGLCVRQYEVGIGYNDIWKLFAQHHEATCQNNIQAMPDPIILSTNTVTSGLYGDYTQRDCDSWDETDTSGHQWSHRVILEKLRQDGQWEAIAENSKRVLSGYHRIYCSESVINQEQEAH